jgi:hypothetical protein
MIANAQALRFSDHESVTVTLRIIEQVSIERAFALSKGVVTVRSGGRSNKCSFLRQNQRERAEGPGFLRKSEMYGARSSPHKWEMPTES